MREPSVKRPALSWVVYFFDCDLLRFVDALADV